jgi:FAD/FMN-containing dehydrogenase
MHTYPNPIDFGVTQPSDTANAVFTITDAESDALLSASIEQSGPGRPFQIISLSSYALRRVQPGEMPGGGPLLEEWDEEDSSDGTQPLSVSRRGKVEVLLQFDSSRAATQDWFTATLSIRDLTAHTHWPPISAQMTAQVARILSNLPDAIEIVQGQSTSVPITVISEAAPDTTVTYTLEARGDGITMMPVAVPLPRDARVTAQLEFAAAADAPLGLRDVTILSNAANHLTTTLMVPVNVLPPPQAPRDICQSWTAVSAPWAQDNQVWSNFGITDSTDTFLGYLPTPKLFRPTNPYEVSNAITEAESASTTIRAFGSGFSFSEAVLPQTNPLSALEHIFALPWESLAWQGKIDDSFLRSIANIFSGRFGYSIDTTTLDRSLQTVLPSLLADNQNPKDFFFVEGGMTIYDLNILLDSQSDKDRLALKTLGGTSAQTIAGAISTGTHGADFDRPPLADSVRAIYLIGAEGIHYWIEPSSPITERGRIRAAFPCIGDANIHYNDDMFRAALVSMGAMGVIYAVILDVVPQYSLLAINRWSTWEQLLADTAPSYQPQWRMEPLFSGAWSGLAEYLQNQFPRLSPPPTNRFLQVVINPIKNNDGTHNCYVTNCAQLPFGLVSPGGVTPIGYGEVLSRFDWVVNAIWNSPDGNLFDRFELALDNALGDFEPKNDILALARKMLEDCKEGNNPWIVRTIIDLIMQKSFPSSSEWTSAWDTMGGNWQSTPVVEFNSTGGLSAFLVGHNGNLYRYDQRGASGPWSLDAVSMEGTWDQDTPAVVARNANGTLSVFLIGIDGILYRKDQEPTGAWPPDPSWLQMLPGKWPTGFPGRRKHAPVVETNPDGTLSVFLLGDELPNLYRYDQDPAGGPWTRTSMLGDWPDDQPPVVARNSAGGLSVFLIGGDDDGLYRYDQDAAGVWAPWPPASMGGSWPHGQPPVVAANPNRRLSVFLIGKEFQGNQSLYRYDEQPNGSWPVTSMEGDWSYDLPPVVSRSPSRGLSVFLIGNDPNHTLYTKDQDAAGMWSAAWQAVLPGNWTRDQPPVVVPNRSGGLSVFLVGDQRHALFRYDQQGANGAWTLTSMQGDWRHDYPVVIGGTPYTGQSVFMIGRDQDLASRIGAALASAFLAALTGGLAQALGGLALGSALGSHLDDALPGGPSLCRYDLSGPQIDIGYKVLNPAPSRPVRGFPTLGGTAVEAAFSFFPDIPSPAQPLETVTVPDVITFVNDVLHRLDQYVDDKVFPAGWLSLRVTGRTSALLGMQQFDPTGTFEIVLIGNPDDYAVVQELEKMAIDHGGALHWGESNGFLRSSGLEVYFLATSLDKWRAAQRSLGKDTFRNVFMQRCGLWG